MPGDKAERNLGHILEKLGIGGWAGAAWTSWKNTFQGKRAFHSELRQGGRKESSMADTKLESGGAQVMGP